MSSSRGIRRGFTLIEILIVVIILGILAAIVIPRFANANMPAKQDHRAAGSQEIVPGEPPAGVR